MAERKSQLDALAFDIQFLISEHAQDLSPQQNRQMLRLLNELQRSFQDLVEETTAQGDALRDRLQQMEQAAQVKVRLNQRLGSVGPWDVLCLWVFWPDSICHDSRSLRLPILIGPGQFGSDPGDSCFDCLSCCVFGFMYACERICVFTCVCVRIFPSSVH